MTASFLHDENARELGVREFMLKPLVMDKLAGTVRKVLDEK